MIEKDKREEVIKGLECNLNFAEKSYCEQCGYECRKAMFISVPVNLLSDALSLLKAEKPNCAAANRDAGGCLGYCHSESDDEPIDICKECKEYTGNREER